MTKVFSHIREGFAHPRSKWRVLLRSIGTELFLMLGWRAGTWENPKTVIRTSRTLAWFSCGVHVIPVATSVVMVYLNLNGLYCGFLTGKITSPAINTALLQIAAKLQELLIVASLTSIVVHSIREQLLTGNGVPLGILGSGFEFTSLSYFWSPGFWGSMKARGPAWTKFRLYGLLLVCGLLAATAGPSSAVLMIPREQKWKAGGGQLYLPGNMSTLWPDEVSYLDSALGKSCLLPNATELPICPSASYSSFNVLGKSDFLLRNVGGSQWNMSTVFIFGEKPIEMPNPTDLIPPFTLHGTQRPAACHTSAIGVDLREATLLNQLLSDWYRTVYSQPFSVLQSSVSEYKYADWIQAESRTAHKVPAVRVGCSPAQNLSSSALKVQFPILQETGCWNQATDLHEVSPSGESTNHMRTQWISLPATFQAAHTGIVIEAPWNDFTDTRVVVGCSIDARWAPGAGSATWRSTARGDIHNFASGPPNFEFSPFWPLKDGLWSRIHLHLSFLQALTPQVTEHNDTGHVSNMTTLETILENMEIANDLSVRSKTQTELWNEIVQGGLNRTLSLEWILAALVADGLSRQGSATLFDTFGPVHNWTLRDYHRSTNFQHEILSGGKPLMKPEQSPVVEDSVHINVQGYAFNASAVTDFLAVAVLLTHVCLTLWHTAELVYRRHSSNCWDSLTELLVLTQNSPPSKALENTGAGIAEMRTYSIKGRVRAVKNPSCKASESARVEIFFSNEADTRPLELQTLLNAPDQRAENATVSSSKSDAATKLAGSRSVSPQGTHPRLNLCDDSRNTSQAALADQIIEQVRPNEAYT